MDDPAADDDPRPASTLASGSPGDVADATLQMVGDLSTAGARPSTAAAPSPELPPPVPGFAPSVAPASGAGRRVGPYLLERRLGAGAFGDVWLALREGELARTRLAVKLPRTQLVDLKAIRQEAELWACLGSHPNILPIFEATLYDGHVVIASEYAAEGSLADWLAKRGGRATPEEATEIISGVVRGLAHLHGQGVVHRDIKPANVLLQHGVPRLADFGVSRALQNGATSRLAGTPAYMAPEAFDGARSVQTDVWSVGVLFHQLLAGALPFPEREWNTLFQAILVREPAPLPADVPAACADIIRRCLEKDPGRRYRSAEAMALDLRSAGRPVAPATGRVRVLAHVALHTSTMRPALFINVTNLSETVDREVTHVWVEAAPTIHIDNERRPLPRRLRPQESWETWIEIRDLPGGLANEGLLSLGRVRLSTGEVVAAHPNEAIPDSGDIPGET